MSSLQRFSGMSFTSRTTFGVEEEIKYEELSDEELNERLQLLTHTNEILELENEVFERYLHRNDSQSLVSMSQVLETAEVISSQMTQVPSLHSRGSESINGSNMRGKNTPLSSGSIGSIQIFSGSNSAQLSAIQPPTRGFRIALLQRIDMANKEIEEMKKELEERERLTIKKRDNLRAQMEEIKMRICDINDARDGLEENVAKKGVDKSTGKILADKFIHYIEMWLKNADRIIDKLRLKTSTIKSQIKKARIQLKQREELGASLHLIDFEALAIENEDYSKQIHEKTQQLMELKKITGQYNFTLNTHKNKLNKQQITLENIKKQINIKENQIKKLNLDLEKTEIQLEDLERRINKIPKAKVDHELRADVTEIIKVQSELEEMKKTHERLERHGNIQLIALKAIKNRQKLIN
ncbi:hypothetical protein PV327_007233 [Microctonus hyperodae]|uniref:Cilia- and flagella-associated protein 263 n=1 Tax=Microctonus hyperodae TaxID=165561 RepID=A0AA39F638_MICHY|nr:hypothetical protein PV327_007233 [Microctonus hyperodae]